jgi:tetratricopeptide (TPR) repeat protein
MNEGVSHFKSTEYEKAIQSFRKAIRIRPKHAEAHLDLGLTYMELYEPGSTHPKDVEYAEGAIQAFKNYIRLAEDSGKARDYLINICKVSMRMDEAIEFFIEDFNKDPDNLDQVRTMAALYRMAGDMEKAIEFYEKAADLDPGNAEAYYSIGVAAWGRSYNSMGLDYESRMALIDKGLAAMERAKQIRADYFEAISYESLLYREKAKYDISPASMAQWRQKADALLTQAMELRNAAMAAQAKEAASEGSETPASTGGSH